jgi:Ecdysteroid kinase-like family
MELAEDVSASLQKLPAQKVRDLLVDALKEQRWTNINSIQVTPGSTLGDGLMAIIYRVRANGLAANGEQRELSLIVKNTPKNKARREAFCVPMLFVNEQAFYEKVVPALEANFSTKSSRPLAVAKFYKSIADGENDALILEDLSEKGYTMADRRLGLDEAHCRVVLAELARLHAASFVLKHKMPDKFEELRGCVKDMFWDEDRKFAFEPFTQSCFEETLRTINIHFKNHDKSSKKYVTAYEQLMTRGYDFIAGIVRGTKLGDQVITHGDCWTNNVLFKYEKEQPVDVKFLDFQLPRISTPALDLTYFLFNSPKCQTMTQNYDSLLDFYHESLSRALSENSLSGDEVFSRSHLDEEMARAAPYGLTMAG